MIDLHTYARTCRGCTGLLYRESYMGWVHLDGGGPVWHRCACGWSGSDASRLARMKGTAAACPACASFNLEADHGAVAEIVA